MDLVRGSALTPLTGWLATQGLVSTQSLAGVRRSRFTLRRLFIAHTPRTRCYVLQCTSTSYPPDLTSHDHTPPRLLLSLKRSKMQSQRNILLV